MPVVWPAILIYATVIMYGRAMKYGSSDVCELSLDEALRSVADALAPHLVQLGVALRPRGTRRSFRVERDGVVLTVEGVPGAALALVEVHFDGKSRSQRSHVLSSEPTERDMSSDGNAWEDAFAPADRPITRGVLR